MMERKYIYISEDTHEKLLHFCDSRDRNINATAEKLLIFTLKEPGDTEKILQTFHKDDK